MGQLIKTLRPGASRPVVRRPRRKGEYLYVAVEKKGRESREWSKIGFSVDPKKRCSSMDMRLVAYWHRPDDGYEIEWQIKQMLADFRCLPQSYEIFAIPAASLVQYAESMVASFDHGPLPMKVEKIIGGKRGILKPRNRKR